MSSAACALPLSSSCYLLSPLAWLYFTIPATPLGVDCFKFFLTFLSHRKHFFYSMFHQRHIVYSFHKFLSKVTNLMANHDCFKWVTILLLSYNFKNTRIICVHMYWEYNCTRLNIKTESIPATLCATQTRTVLSCVGVHQCLSQIYFAHRILHTLHACPAESVRT